MKYPYHGKKLADSNENAIVMIKNCLGTLKLEFKDSRNFKSSANIHKMQINRADAEFKKK